VNHQSPSEIRSVLAELGLRLQKRWGQNFLINRAVRDRIVGLIQPRATNLVWEIGPGLGALTELLLPQVRRLVVFEIDRGLIGYLEREFGAHPAFVLVAGDALKRWPERYAEEAPDAIIGNLPYSSASALVGAFAEARISVPRVVVTVQRELARRMVAAPGGKDYSSFSVLCQSAFGVQECFDLKPGSFFPAPAVTSTVVELKPLHSTLPAGEWDFFLRVLRGLFRSRRKTIRNNLLGAGLPGSEGSLYAALQRAGVEPGQRGEELTPEQIMRLAAEIRRAFSG
jgi:16S rRNA (adenine1518-N6/adenine1519-N6)-dimethyltransferase